jgi:cytoskeletal protein RodZ
MTQHSEERLPETEGAPSMRAGARILPFERPQSELQRAIQQRAQEALDLDRERAEEKRRPQPLKWITIFALACIPVLLTIVAVDGFLRVFHKVMETYSSEPQQQPTAPAETESVSQPGVVMLESYDAPTDAQRSATSPDASPPPAANSPQQR